jgi:hypothetical protein
VKHSLHFNPGNSKRATHEPDLSLELLTISSDIARLSHSFKKIAFIAYPSRCFIEIMQSLCYVRAAKTGLKIPSCWGRLIHSSSAYAVRTTPGDQRGLFTKRKVVS